MTSKSSTLPPEEMKGLVKGFAHKLEQYYRWDFVTKVFDNPYVDVVLTDSKPWSLGGHW